MKNARTVTLRIPEDILQKSRCVCNAQGQTLNNYLLMLIRNNIAYYERSHSRITPAQIAALPPFSEQEDEILSKSTEDS